MCEVGAMGGIRLQGILATCVIRFCVFVFAAKSWLRFLVNEDGNGAQK